MFLLYQWGEPAVIITVDGAVETSVLSAWTARTAAWPLGTMLRVAASNEPRALVARRGRCMGNDPPGQPPADRRTHSYQALSAPAVSDWNQRTFWHKRHMVVTLTPSTRSRQR